MSEAARSFLEAVAGYGDSANDETRPEDKPVKLGTVDAAYTGGAPKVLLDGETLMGVRTYPTVVPVKASDRVVMLPQGHTYVIVGVLPASSGAFRSAQPLANRVLNGLFRINQRGYVSAAALALNAFGFDRWKANAAATTLTYTAGAHDTTVTINSGGGILQRIERADVAAGQYVLSWAGTATGRVYNQGAGAPGYAASPIVVTLDGTADVVVEFTATGATKTLGQVQLTEGAVTSSIERLPLDIELDRCKRYFERLALGSAAPTGVAITATKFAVSGDVIIANVPMIAKRRAVVIADATLSLTPRFVGSGGTGNITFGNVSGNLAGATMLSLLFSNAAIPIGYGFVDNLGDLSIDVDL